MINGVKTCKSFQSSTTSLDVLLAKAIKYKNSIKSNVQ